MDVVKPIVQLVVAPAAVEVGDTETVETDFAAVIVTDLETPWVSELVDTVVLTEPVLVGLVTSTSTTERTSPALAEYPWSNEQFIVVPPLQLLLSGLPVVVSVTAPLWNEPRLTPAGRATVTLAPG